MNEEALRAMIRESVARHLAQAGQPDELGRRHGLLPMTDHPSHYRYSTLPATPGPCYIEPGVTCSHCGFCESHGH